ncbi:hypothetical protein C8Q80DRAFT_1334842 [Daedaleopsis nitida]|nr:hypothetical protein C8Q80DRAFT_1334842 [Daedaleopsis nitida]
MVKQYEYLSQADVDHFLEHGYIVVKNAFSRAQAAEFAKDVWVRLGVDPHDRATWDRERVHMPVHRREPVATFAPRAWGAITELLGGEDRIDPAASAWGDSFIQALLVIPLFTDILPGGGATYIAPDGLSPVARFLAAHPQGVYPRQLSFVPSGVPGASDLSVPLSALRARAGEGAFWSHLDAARACSNFVELTGSAGDVVLMHPLMLHSASPNLLRAQRVITNPPVALKAPFRFARTGAPGDEYSVVERATLRALGVDRLEFAVAREREGVVPARVGLQAKMVEEERRRLEEARARRADAPQGVTGGGGLEQREACMKQYVELECLSV